MQKLNTRAPRAHAIAILATLGIVLPKSYNLAKIREKCEAIAQVLRDVIATHESLKGAYFWRPASNSSARRASEFDCKHILGDVVIYQYRVNSCRNVYYALKVFKGDRKKDVRELHAMLAKLNFICGQVAK